MLTRRYQDEKNVHQTSAVMKMKSISVKYMYKYLINTLQNPISMFYLTYHSSEHRIRPVHFRLEKVLIVDTSDNFR